MRSTTGIVALIALGLVGFAHAVSVIPDELAEARSWVAAKWAALPPGPSLEPAGVPLPLHGPVRNQDPPFSFVYGGRPSADLLKDWELKRGTPAPGTGQARREKAEHTLVCTDPETGLQVRCVAVEYHDFPTVEWTLFFKNTGTRDTPILTSCSGGFLPGLKCNEADESRFIDAFTQAGGRLDHWWMDAGWYPCGDGWPQVGTWTPDPTRFPHGLKAVSDHAHAKGMGLIVWSNRNG